MSIAPEPYASACLAVLQHAIVRARLIAYRDKHDRLADLMDAVHNIPDLLQRWEQCDERLLRSFLAEFDRKWREPQLLVPYVQALAK
jgi:hypothetical protein